MKNNKSIIVPSIGMRIKIALPTDWCQVNSNKSYQWLKGRIIEIPLKDFIIISVKSKKVGRMKRLLCLLDEETGSYRKVIKCK